MDDIVTRLRRWNDSMVSTHWEGCSNVHPVCQMALAADEIERLQGLLHRAYGLAVGHGPDFDVFESWEDALDAYEARHG
jgi:hypothetical protein